MQHAKLSPSSSSRWLQCPASLTYDADDKGNEMANRGTAIHQIGEGLLNGEEFQVKQTIKVDLGDSNQYFVIDDDMLLEAQNYANYCNDYNGSMSVEKRVDLTMLYPDTFGHVDCVVFDSLTNHLHIIDLKTGRVPVSANENTQLMLYAYGILVELEDDFEIVDTITLHIVQDNEKCHNTNSWTLSSGDLRRWIDDVVKPAISLVDSDNPIYKPSDSACLWCPGRTQCKALNDMIIESFDKCDTLTDDEMIKVLKLEKVIASTIKSYRNKLEEQLLTGEVIEGVKLIESKPRKKWIDEDDALKKCSAWLTKADVTSTKIKTPLQIAKLLGSDISNRKANLFKALIDEGSISPKLVFSEDKGKLYDFNDAFNDTLN